MKWKNKGHEFDELYINICKKKNFYLFGAGDYGLQFLKALKNEISIEGFLDNNIKKQNREIMSFPCMGLDQVGKLNSDQAIIITMSQMARLTAVKQLIEAGYKKNKDFFIMEEFMSVYYLYKHNEVYLSSISFMPSTTCNLKCAQCLQFNPFLKDNYIRNWNDVVSDIDVFFECVDKVMLFQLSGGEPLLYKYTVDIIKYIDKKYKDRIITLRTITNGTIVPSDDVLEAFSQCAVELVVDDYRDSVSQYNKNFDELISKLKKYKIKHYINKADIWIDLAPERTDYSFYTDEELQLHSEECNHSWQELREGKLYSCNYAAYAEVAGLTCKDNSEETFDLKEFSNKKKKELVEFRLGYNSKGYTNFCKNCKGFNGENVEYVLPAAQLI